LLALVGASVLFGFVRTKSLVPSSARVVWWLSSGSGGGGRPEGGGGNEGGRASLLKGNALRDGRCDLHARTYCESTHSWAHEQRSPSSVTRSGRRFTCAA